MRSNTYIAPLQGIYSETLSALAYMMLNVVMKECVQSICKTKHYKIGPGRVDIFNRVANPSIWKHYLPNPGTNRVSFVYMYKIKLWHVRVGCWVPPFL